MVSKVGEVALSVECNQELPESEHKCNHCYTENGITKVRNLLSIYFDSDRYIKFTNKENPNQVMYVNTGTKAITVCLDCINALNA